MATVRFNLRNDLKDDPGINLVYRLQGKKIAIGTGLRVPKKFWNRNEMRIRETSKFIDHTWMNHELESWRSAVNEVIKRCKLSGNMPTRDKFRNEVRLEKGGESSRHHETSFYVCFQNYINLLEEGRGTLSTIKQYRNALNHLNDYRVSKLHGKSIDFNDLTERFFVNFINYLRDRKKHQQNTIHKIIKKIRAVLNDATRKGLNTLMEYKSKKCQVPYIKQPKIYLDMDEIEAIRNTSLSSKRLERVRDKFLIGVRTGLRFSDFNRLSSDHITIEHSGRKYIEILTIKDKKLPRIILSSEVEDILSKYHGYPPKISEPKFNEYLKELCEFAGIDSIVNRIEDGVQVQYKKHELVSSHICRRSFATNGFKAGIHPKHLMKVTDHTTIQMFMDYICIDDDESLALLSNHEFMS